ncbi:hypothetical protein J3B00_003625 [Pseudomonas sp. BP8]|nr:hypothetical protein [Pseudomonas sp. BP8]
MPISWEKVTKNRLLLHPALRCATDPLAPVLLREDRAVRPLLGLSAFRPSMASTSLRKTSTRPPEVAKLRAASGLALFFIVAWVVNIRASSRGKPAPTGIAQIVNKAQSL